MDAILQYNYDRKYSLVNGPKRLTCSSNSCVYVHNDRTIIKQVDDLEIIEESFSKVSIGEFHFAGIRENKTLKVWGDNDFGQFFRRSNVRDVACGGTFTLVIDENRKISGHGFYEYFEPGELSSGEGTDFYENFFDEEYCQVACGFHHCVAIKNSNKRIRYWGKNPNLDYRDFPSDRVLSVSCGYDFSAAITENFEVKVWGNADGIFPPSGRKYLQVSCGDKMIAVLDIDGKISVYGENEDEINEIISDRIEEEDNYENIIFSEVQCCGSSVVGLAFYSGTEDYFLIPFIHDENEILENFPYDLI